MQGIIELFISHLTFCFLNCVCDSERGFGRGRGSSISKTEITAEDLLTDSRSTLDDDSVHGECVFVSLVLGDKYHLLCIMLARITILL